MEVLTEQFVHLVGNVPGWWGWRGGEGDGAVPPAGGTSGRLDDDVRLRRYSELWCRYILILSPAADLRLPEDSDSEAQPNESGADKRWREKPVSG